MSSPVPIKATRNVRITFGLVHFECGVFAATDNESGPTLHLTHEHDDGSTHRVTTQYTCKAEGCGEVLRWGHCTRGVQIGDDLVPVSEDEVASLDFKTSECQVLQFVAPDEVPVEMFGQLYYLAPTPPARSGQRRKPLESSHSRAYTLLREALRREGLAAIVSISLRNRTTRGMLYVRDDRIMLRMLLWPAQVREPRFSGYPDGRFPECELTEAELDMASRLVRAMSGKFDRDDHVDPYATRLSEIIEAKTARPVASAPEPGGQVIDLVSRLDAAVQRATAG